MYDLFSMGMFCVDEIHTAQKSYSNIIGGAGTYAALGAGTVLPREDRHKVGFICDEGYDFSPEMHQEIMQWRLGTIFRKDQTRETTKAWNKFINNEERLFKYLSPKRQIFVDDLPGKARDALTIHLICSAQRCDDFMHEFRFHQVPGRQYIWEPVPTECHPAEFENLKRIFEVHQLDVLSPNALEAAALVGLPEPNSTKEVEQLVTEHYRFVPTIVVRCGAMGSYVRSPDLAKWYPAYHAGDPSKVVDPSGAGNAFTGALGLAMAQRKDWDESMAMANVGASFMIEQVGPPRYDPQRDLWNGESGPERIQLYMKKLKRSK